MPRRRDSQARDPARSQILSSDVAKFVNVLMSQGKKSVAERIVYGALSRSPRRAARIPWKSSPRRWVEREADGGRAAASVARIPGTGGSAGAPVRWRSRVARSASAARSRWASALRQSCRSVRRGGGGEEARGSIAWPSEQGLSHFRFRRMIHRRPILNVDPHSAHSDSERTWQEPPPSSGIGTSASVRTLMPERPRPPSAYFSTPGFPTRWARSTTVRP